MATLKEMRKSRKMTQAELANQIGKSRSAVCLYEQGKREPSINVARKIAAVFDVSLDLIEIDSHEK